MGDCANSRRVDCPSPHRRCTGLLVATALGRGLLGRGQVPVDTRPGHPQRCRDWVGLSPFARRARAAASLSASITVGRPPTRPRARAAANPANVRSCRMSRSSSANAAIIVKKNFPSPGRAVGPRQLPRQNPQPHLPLMQIIRDRRHVLHRATEPVEFPHSQDIAVIRPQVVQGGGQSRSGGAAGGHLLFKDPTTPGGGEGIALQLGVLQHSRHPRQADEVAMSAHHAAHHRTTHLRRRAPARRFCDALWTH